MIRRRDEPTRIVAFEPLIPPRAGDATRRRDSLSTRGRRGAEALDVVVFDRSIALQALRSGGWALGELERAVDGVSEAHRLPDQKLDAWLEERRLALRTDPLAIDDYG